MKKYLFLLILAFNAIVLYSQKEECRTYYVDITASMDWKNTGKPWNKTKDILKNAIYNIKNPQTEIIIVPFANQDLKLNKCQSFATEEGKIKLTNFIDKLQIVNKKYGSDIYIAFEDFYSSLDESKINYFFLLTDGEQLKDRQNKLDSNLNKWNIVCKNGEKHIYGFYTLLNPNDKNSYEEGKEIKHQNEKKKHLWATKNIDLNINIIELDSNITFNNNDTIIDIKVISGDLTDRKLNIINNKSDICEIYSHKLIENNTILRLYIKNKQDLLPQSSDFTINIKLDNPHTFDFLLTNQIHLNYTNLTNSTIIEEEKADIVEFSCKNFRKYLFILLIILLIILMIYLLYHYFPFSTSKLPLSMPTIINDSSDNKETTVDEILELEKQLYTKISISKKYEILEIIRIKLDNFYKNDEKKYKYYEEKLRPKTWSALEEAWKLWNPTPKSKGNWGGANDMTFTLDSTNQYYDDCLNENFIQCTYDEHGSPNFDKVTFSGSIVNISDLYEEMSIDAIAKRGGGKNSLQEIAQARMEEQLRPVIQKWAKDQNKQYDPYWCFYEWRDANNLVPHEDTNCQTMRLVYRPAHQAFKHRGGIANAINIKKHFDLL